MGYSAIIQKAVCVGATLTAFYTNKSGTTCASTSGSVTVNTPSALTNQGIVQGYTEADTGNHVFLGIPYAASTAGNNRWRAPQAPAKSLSFVNATSYGHTCPQAITGTTYSAQGEDCLNVNIWTPSSGSNLPVFVYLYGGAMVTGSQTNPEIVGSNFASKDVIYVNMGMRESIFASPYSKELAGQQTSQNFGILDVEAGIQWVYDNIAGFGGNPNAIVIGGHSSGSVQVDHYLWNHPNTFLAGAVEMSANAESGPGYATENAALDNIAASVGCPLSNQTGSGSQLDCLRKVSMYDLETSAFNSSVNTYFTPVIDEITRFSNYPARFAAGKYPTNVPMIVGNSDKEGKIFEYVYGSENTDFSSWINTFDADSAHIPDSALLATYNVSNYESDSDMSGAQYGDARFFCPTDYLLDMRSAKQNTWIYRWFGNYSDLPISGLGPSHGSEVPFFHGGNACFSDFADVVTDEWQEVADFMNDWLVKFIKNPSAGPGWSKATAVSGPLTLVGVPGNVTDFIPADTADYNSKCQSLYKKYFPAYPVVQNPFTL